MKVIQAEAKDLKIGDRVINDDGEAVKIIAIHKSMIINHIEFQWNKGWMATHPSTLLEKVV